MLARLVVLIIAVCFGIGCENEASVQDRAPVIRAIKYTVVVAGRTEKTKRYTGLVQAVDFTRLSFRVGGQVLKVNVKPGDKVRKGEVVAT